MGPFAAAVTTSDDFADGLGLQWQRQANPQQAWFESLKPGLRLYCAPCGDFEYVRVSPVTA